MAGLIQTRDPSERTAASAPLIDGCGRRVDSLRLSVTDVCDLHCIYCRPSDGQGTGHRRAVLSDAQRVRFVRFLRDRYGLSQLRITGGEPLLYPGLVSLVAAIREAVPDLPLAMTTSGRRLDRLAAPLRRAGLDRLNVSVDSLDPDRYRHITGGELDEVLRGLSAAGAAGFAPPRINAVVLRGVNDEEIIPLTQWALSRGSEIRFLEAMPIGPAAASNERGFVSAAEVKRRIETAFRLKPLPEDVRETSRRFSASSSHCRGTIGLISPLSEPFCGGCRRIRLTAEGCLFPCLLDSRSVDISKSWSTDAFDASVADGLLQSAVADKQPRGRVQAAPMVTLGG